MTSVDRIDDLAREIHKTAVDHGFWPAEGRNLGEMLMLATSELAEALEEDRSGKPHIYWACPECGFTTHLQPMTEEDQIHAIPDDHKILRNILRMIGLVRKPIDCDYAGQLKPEGALVEVIDCIIRCLDTAQDMAGRTKYTVYEVMRLKMNYNHTRAYKHGKGY